MKRFAYTNFRLAIGLMLPPLVGLLLFTISNPGKVFGSTIFDVAVLVFGAYFYLGMQAIIYTLFMEGIGRLLLYRLNRRSFALGLLLAGGLLGTLTAASLNFMEASNTPSFRFVVSTAALTGIIPVFALWPCWQLARRHRVKQQTQATSDFAA